MREGIVLFAHGSRDPQWASPFRALEQELARRLPGTPVRLAFLEIQSPALGEALRELEAQGAGTIRVVPLFLGFGGHLREDLPRLVAAAKPKAKVTIDPPVGEAPSVLEAIAALVARR